jgi:hypothetical protein
MLERKTTPGGNSGGAAIDLQAQILKKFSGFSVSTLWRTCGSTVRTNPSVLLGMLAMCYSISGPGPEEDK